MCTRTMIENDFPRVRRRTLLKTVGVAGAAMTLPGVGAADCGDTTSVGRISDSLSGFGDSDCYYLTLDSAPCYVDLRLTSDASNADFDLYANLDSSSCPSPLLYEYASDTPDEDARITIYDPDPETDSLSVLVYAERGSGEYTLAIETHQ